MLKNTKENKNSETIFNQQSSVQVAQAFDVDFDYVSTTNASKPASICHGAITITLKEVAELEANQKVNVKATLSKGIDCPKRIEIKAQNKIMLFKEDCILEDCTGTAPFHIWRSLIEELFDGCSYEFFNLCVKQFQGSVYLATSLHTTFKEVEQQVEILQGPSLLVNVEKQITVKQFDFVKKLSIFVSCQFCKRKITEILADDLYVKWQNQSCGARQRKSIVKQMLLCSYWQIYQN